MVDLGLDVSGTKAYLVEAGDVATWLPRRAVAAHKWQSACWVIAGSPGMGGAATLAATAAANTGAGYVRLSSPGAAPEAPLEIVVRDMGGLGWAATVDDAHRFGSIVLGPGLGRDAATQAEIKELLARVGTPTVLDADGLAAIGNDVTLMHARPGPSASSD